MNERKDGPIARVGLNRPKERKARDAQLLMELHRASREINADEGIRVVILHPCLPEIFSGGDAREGILARQERCKPNLPGTYARDSLEAGRASPFDVMRRKTGYQRENDIKLT